MSDCDLPLLQRSQMYRVTGTNGQWRVSVHCKTAVEASSFVVRCLELSRHAVAVVWLTENGQRTFIRRFSRW